MEDTWRWTALTAVAPVAWGATYYVTRAALPAEAPLWGAALRALPAAVLLLLVARRRPHGAWWWRAPMLGFCTVGAFFVLVYAAAQLLPTSVAASVMAASPLVMAGAAWALVGERPTAWMLLGSLVGIAGVLLVVAVGTGGVDGRGVAASGAALVMSAVGYVLTKRWAHGTPPLTVTAWQLAAGSVMLLIAAVAVEGAPPALGTRALAGLAFVSLVATALAFVCWFAGLAHLRAGTVGIVGLLNPVTGVLLGIVLAHERLTWWQGAGIALVIAGILLGRTTRSSAATATMREPHSSTAVTEPDGAMASKSELWSTTPQGSRAR